MSTIASPRDHSVPGHPRRVPSSQNILTTPTSSTRPSLDTPRGSPNPNSASSSAPPPVAGQQQQQQQQQRRNRAALREYYNLKKAANPDTPTVEITEDALGISIGLGGGGGGGGDGGPRSAGLAPASEMDRPDFDAEGYVKRALEGCGLEELLRRYARVLGEIRALDAEKKALVYDNYSKLIAATETIKKRKLVRQMRENMDPLNPMASTLDPAIAQIYSQASSIREELRRAVPPPDDDDDEQAARRKRTRELAVQVLAAPERIRKLVREGREDEAREAWAMPRRLLETWREKGLGGADVEACLREGDAALRGEDSATS
ncbi:uncharacterized protein E0L32_002751 [Thyridium curvatum]|uniref:Vacuolar protein sorting-associated protein 51 homolog n=1 Tax=Thyridium curvatum TaxID=1093900 RepID=A0A507B7E3_9PEZI|nr:uncharacterized protein E0L32_002751 [Thyridium curvatum]TPX18242.1 hypothetical protein E0L32_002751 [Thyridium curvatum]